MTNIWGFLRQTLSISVVAGLLLFIKLMLNDKLSPRWQYGIWGILASRILIPVSTEKYLVFPISLWIETLKAFVERDMQSNYAAVYQIVNMKHVIPILTNQPKSLTDWLHVIYITGVLGYLVWYLISYLRLKLLLQKGEMPSPELTAKINSVCEKYGLKSCKTVVIRNLPTAFICSGIKPLLVLPEDELDDKVILHELIHLKYHDELQNVFWCLLRCLHWCNPFMQYVFCRIENDMESLCDQRVLERLEGEERRAYGIILLNMANEKYARVPGTSSISNGGRNIRRRIASIVRFKKYPKGMALVSVCIGIMLIIPVLGGTSYAYSEENYHPETQAELTMAMAIARVSRCSTVAGAIDTYAKGLIYENGIYIASSTPISNHEMLENEMRKNTEENKMSYLLDAGDEFEAIYGGYTVFNLVEKEKNIYEAYLVFQIINEEGRLVSLLAPITITKEEGWVVEERGERMATDFDLTQIIYPEVAMEPMKEYVAVGETGTVKLSFRTLHIVNNQTAGEFFFTGITNVDEKIKLDAEFDKVRLHSTLIYTYQPNEDGNLPVNTCGFHWILKDSQEEIAEFTENIMEMDSTVYWK